MAVSVSLVLHCQLSLNWYSYIIIISVFDVNSDGLRYCDSLQKD